MAVAFSRCGCCTFLLHPACAVLALTLKRQEEGCCQVSSGLATVHGSDPARWPVALRQTIHYSSQQMWPIPGPPGWPYADHIRPQRVGYWQRLRVPITMEPSAPAMGVQFPKRPQRGLWL
jgi:hypothetical protein